MLCTKLLKVGENNGCPCQLVSSFQSLSCLQCLKGWNVDVLTCFIVEGVVKKDQIQDSIFGMDKTWKSLRDI